MDFFTSLLKAYETAEETGLVDQEKSAEQAILLPIYHSSLKSNGKNIISVQLDKNVQFYKSEIMSDKKTIIYPVTADSVARSGSSPAPHPLVDKFSYYLSEIDQSQYDSFHQQLANWINYCDEGEVKQFLIQVQQFILQPDCVEQIIHSLFGSQYQREGLKVSYIDSDEKDKTVDLSAYFLEFSIVQFRGFKNESVTSFKALHQSFISFVEAHKTNLGVCNISGREEQITTKHRGLMGNAKIISVSNKNEAYKGRFQERGDVFSVGYETSEKIHLMVKYLLENDHTSTWLGSSQYLINWFSDDLANDSQLDIVKPEIESLFEDEEDEIQIVRPLSTDENRKIGSSFIKGKKQFSDNATYYVAILNKTSNGRIALKYFRELKVSQLLENLNKWQDKYSWEVNYRDRGYVLKTPTFDEIIKAAYGVDRERFLELDNDSFRSDQYQKLVTSLLDGRPIPDSLVRKFENNIKERHRYRKNWHRIEQVSLAILQQKNKEVFTPMVDRENTNRSYLFGRLLAIFELIELQRYRIDGNDNSRLTNAERYWTAYTNQPAKMMESLTNKIKPYEEVLKLQHKGIWHKLEKEREEVIALLAPLMETKEFNSSLDYRFIFGYYAEKQFFYTKQIKESEE
ncbi:type I-C CRISPR-associated protein Cas8c/Csd1 [Streptococcus cameli]